MGSRTWTWVCVVAAACAAAGQGQPPALDPFGPREDSRADAVPGYVELSDGSVHAGQVFLTRDHRLKVFDGKQERHREIPLRAVRRVECKVGREWLEKEWRFKESASDEIVYTGRSYPVREYVHVITLRDGRTIEGTLSGIVYVRADKQDETRRFLLHKRQRGETDTALKALLHVKAIRLGEAALEEGKKKAAKQSPGRAG
jgi:hypothetical protein